MKNIRVFLSENFQFLQVKFSLYLNRRIFVMFSDTTTQMIHSFFFSENSKSYVLLVCAREKF